MKIATYNVWNEESNFALRADRIIDEINRVGADIIGLQEVMPEFWTLLLEHVDYRHNLFHIIESRGDGLAFLSKYPLECSFFLNESAEFQHSLALNVTFRAEGKNFSVTNVHLPWDSPLAKERQIVAMNEFVNRQKSHIDFFLLLGDFNCGHSSSVHNFLIGEQSLLGCEVNPEWQDLAGIHAALNHYEVAPTLDFATNPRWKGNNTKYAPVTVDRIYWMDNCPNGDYRISNAGIFGTDVSPETGLAPSDHYGVVAEVEFTD